MSVLLCDCGRHRTIRTGKRADREVAALPCECGRLMRIAVSAPTKPRSAKPPCAVCCVLCGRPILANQRMGEDQFPATYSVTWPGGGMLMPVTPGQAVCVEHAPGLPVRLSAPPNLGLQHDEVGRMLGRFGLDIVRRVDDNEQHLVMLVRGHAGYAVCNIDVAQRVVSTHNYDADDGIMSAVISRKGLDSVLDWSDLPTAITRFEIASGHTSSFVRSRMRTAEYA